MGSRNEWGQIFIFDLAPLVSIDPMARPLRIQYRDAYYHVTCRGNDRRSIYRDDSDRELFLEKIKASLEIYGVALHAYLLMGNHFMCSYRPRKPTSPSSCGILILPIPGRTTDGIRVGPSTWDDTKRFWWRVTFISWSSAATSILTGSGSSPTKERLCRAMEGIEKVPVEQFERLPEGD